MLTTLYDLASGLQHPEVGEGFALSRGQRQRVAMPVQFFKIHFAGEINQADYHTERQVCLNLAQARSHRLFITHRLATIKHADVILMMEQGTVLEQGTHGTYGFKGSLLPLSTTRNPLSINCQSTDFHVRGGDKHEHKQWNKSKSLTYSYTSTR